MSCEFTTNHSADAQWCPLPQRRDLSVSRDRLEWPAVQGAAIKGDLPMYIERTPTKYELPVLSHRQAIPVLCEAYARHVRRAESTVIRWASGSGDTLKRLDEGRPFTDARLDRIVRWFADNWPDDLEFPDGVVFRLPVAAPKSRRARLPMTKFLEEVLHRHFGTAEARSEMAEDFAALICLLILIAGVFLALPFLVMPFLGGAH